jgi:hypothetical protein
MRELRDSMVPRLPKQTRQLEAEPRKIPIRSRGKRTCGVSAFGGIFGRMIASFQGNLSYIPLECDDTFPGR